MSMPHFVQELMRFLDLIPFRKAFCEGVISNNVWMYFHPFHFSKKGVDSTEVAVNCKTTLKRSEGYDIERKSFSYG
ncbi:hypothetical protein SUGI_1019220 [Cryptomeria japonica]|nr:hypothetical protein SUGI_1019220 [Cryptomeria japonica]